MNHRFSLRSRRLIFLGVAFSGILLGCDGGHEIQLERRDSTSPPLEGGEGTIPKPENPGEGTGPVNSLPGQIGDDSRGGSVSPVNEAILLCETPSPGWLALLSASASGREIPNDIDFVEAGRRAGGDDGIAEVRGVVSLGADSSGRQIDLLFDGQRGIHHGSSRAIFLSTVRVLNRDGEVREVAASVVPHLKAAAVAERLELPLRSYGASDDGVYLILPKGSGYEILSRNGLKRVGGVALSATLNFQPTFWTQLNLLTVLSFDPTRSRFLIRAFHVDRTASGSLQLRAVSPPSATNANSQLGAVAWGAGELAWLEADVDAEGAQAGSAQLVVWAPERQEARREMVSAAAETHLHFQPVRWSQGPTTKAVLAFKPSRAVSGSGAKTVHGAELRVLDLSRPKAKMVQQIPYPSDVLSRWTEELTSPRGTWLAADPLGETFFVALPTRYGVRTHRFVNGSLEPVTSFACLNPIVTRDVK